MVEVECGWKESKYIWELLGESMMSWVGKFCIGRTERGMGGSIWNTSSLADVYHTTDAFLLSTPERGVIPRFGGEMVLKKRVLLLKRIAHLETGSGSGDFPRVRYMVWLDAIAVNLCVAVKTWRSTKERVLLRQRRRDLPFLWELRRKSPMSSDASVAVSIYKVPCKRRKSLVTRLDVRRTIFPKPAAFSLSKKTPVRACKVLLKLLSYGPSLHFRFVPVATT